MSSLPLNDAEYKGLTPVCSSCTLAEVAAADKESRGELQWLELPGIPDSVIGIDRVCNATKDVSKSLSVLAAEATEEMNDRHKKLLKMAQVWQRVFGGITFGL